MTQVVFAKWFVDMSLIIHSIEMSVVKKFPHRKLCLVVYKFYFKIYF